MPKQRSMYLKLIASSTAERSAENSAWKVLIEVKLHRSPRGHGTIANKASQHGQMLCVDWGFICQKSSDPTRVKRLTSINGDTSYLIFTCAITGVIYGTCASSKSIPTKWLHIFLHRILHGLKDVP